MPVNCSVCSLSCDEPAEIIKCVGVCQNVFHIKCASTKNHDSQLLTRGAKKEWQCDGCKPAKDKSSLSSSKSASFSTAVTKEFLVKTFEAFKNEVFEELHKNSKDFTDFRASLDFFSDALDKTNKLMEEVRTSCNELKKENQELRRENLALKNQVTSVEIRMRNLEQYSRRTNIEISGVPETKGEVVGELLQDVAKAVRVDMRHANVVAAHRVPTFNKQRAAPIIVKFVTSEERDMWITAFKEVRPLTADKINPAFNKVKVFINEHLSPENKKLLSKTKEVAREKGYKYVWSREGKLFVRRENGDRCKKIDSESDLIKL